jgi:hypothetical protein
LQTTISNEPLSVLFKLYGFDEVWRTFSEVRTLLVRLGLAAVARPLPGRIRLRAPAICALLMAWGCPSAAANDAQMAQETQTAILSAKLTPEHLGAGTTIDFGFTIHPHEGQAPSPLTGVDLYYPENLGIATSGLGLETCSVAILETAGVEGCPSQSQMGYGQALVEVPFGPTILYESTQTTIFMTRVHHGHLGLLFYAIGETPVSAHIVFPGLVLPARNPFGGELSTTIPLVPTLPGAPNAAIVELHSTIGPLNLTYYEHTHGRYVPYHPRGIILPRACPRGGFQFAARFSFEDGSRTSARAVVPCPRR